MAERVLTVAIRQDSLRSGPGVTCDVCQVELTFPYRFRATPSGVRSFPYGSYDLGSVRTEAPPTAGRVLTVAIRQDSLRSGPGVTCDVCQVELTFPYRFRATPSGIRSPEATS